MSPRQEHGQEDKLELKMTSMIDVVFLLLIFFIVTLQIPEEEAMIETTLPEKETKDEAQKQQEREREAEFEDVMLALRKEQGSVQTYVNNQPIPSLKLLINRLQTFRELNPEGRVVIDCADDVPYQALVRAINAAQIAELDIAFANL